MDNVIVPGLLSILAALIGGLIAIYIPRRNARRDAGHQLIAEFAALEADFNRIAYSDTRAIDPILREAFPRLETQINIFKRHLYWWEKRSFTKAWIAYYNAYGDNRCQCYHHYLPFKGEYFEFGKLISSNDNTKKYKINFKNNVENILKYAKQV